MKTLILARFLNGTPICLLAAESGLPMADVETILIRHWPVRVLTL